MLYIYTVEHYVVVQIIGFMKVAYKWVELENIISI